jgi:hypothetical protein
MQNLLVPLNPKKASFGRHETFALRYSWLTKGFQVFEKNQSIFTPDKAKLCVIHVQLVTSTELASCHL